MRVMRESSWGKLINNQVTRWVGSRQIDMSARGTQKTRTEATCSHKTETQAHGQQTNHQPCAKQDMNTQQHNKTRVDKSARCRANSRPRTHTMTENGARVSEPRHRNSRHECRDPNTTLQHETRHADERARDSSTLEAARSHENADMTGVSGLCHKTMNKLDRSDRTLTLYSIKYSFKIIK